MPQGRLHGSVDIKWGDGEHTFRLALGNLRELQTKTNCGPVELFKRFNAGTWLVDDVVETVRIGLIGGGMPPVQALALVQRYVLERPLAESVPVAQAVVMVALYGDVDDLQGEQVRQGSQTGPTEGSPLPASTAPVQ